MKRGFHLATSFVSDPSGGNMKEEAMKHPSIPLTSAIAVAIAAGCANSPVPAQPVAVVPTPLPAVSATAAPVPSATSDVEVRVAPVVPAANRTRALLIVQNHDGTEATQVTFQQLGDWLATALGADAFSVVNPHDVIGTTQNIGPWGEKMPEASAVELAAKIGTPVLLTASVTDVRVRNVGGTDPGVQAVMDFTLSAKAVPGGDLLASVNATARSKKQASRIAFDQNASSIWSEVAKEGACRAAPALAKAWRESGARPQPAAPVRAFFAANVPGANVRLDGVSYGTVGADPLAVSVTPGMHNLEIAYPGMEPFKDLAMIQEGSSFVTVLKMTDAAALKAKEDAYFAALLDRVNRSGLTDDMVREAVGKGYAQYLTQSHAKIEGMPKVQMSVGEAPSLGLGAVAPAKPAETPTTAELLQKVASLLK